MKRPWLVLAAMTLCLMATAPTAQAANKQIRLAEHGTVEGPAGNACSFGYCTYYYNGVASGQPFEGKNVPFSGAVTGVEPVVDGCFSEASGSFSFLDRRTNILAFSKAVDGQLCLTSAGGHTFTGGFTIYDGVYRYAGATGSGTMTLSATAPDGTFTASERGSISY